MTDSNSMTILPVSTYFDRLPNDLIEHIMLNYASCSGVMALCDVSDKTKSVRDRNSKLVIKKRIHKDYNIIGKNLSKKLTLNSTRYDILSEISKEMVKRGLPNLEEWNPIQLKAIAKFDELLNPYIFDIDDVIKNSHTSFLYNMCKYHIPYSISDLIVDDNNRELDDWYDIGLYDVLHDIHLLSIDKRTREIISDIPKWFKYVADDYGFTIKVDSRDKSIDEKLNEITESIINRIINYNNILKDMILLFIANIAWHYNE